MSASFLAAATQLKSTHWSTRAMCFNCKGMGLVITGLMRGVKRLGLFQVIFYPPGFTSLSVGPLRPLVHRWIAQMPYSIIGYKTCCPKHDRPIIGRPRGCGPRLNWVTALKLQSQRRGRWTQSGGAAATSLLLKQGLWTPVTSTACSSFAFSFSKERPV